MERVIKCDRRSSGEWKLDEKTEVHGDFPLKSVEARSYPEPCFFLKRASGSLERLFCGVDSDLSLVQLYTDTTLSRRHFLCSDVKERKWRFLGRVWIISRRWCHVQNEVNKTVSSNKGEPHTMQFPGVKINSERDWMGQFCSFHKVIIQMKCQQ